MPPKRTFSCGTNARNPELSCLLEDSATCVPTVGNFFTKGLPGGGEFVIYKFFSFYHFETETLCMHKEDSVGQVVKSLKLGAHVIGSLENTSLLLLPIKRVLTSLSTLQSTNIPEPNLLQVYSFSLFIDFYMFSYMYFLLRLKMFEKTSSSRTNSKQPQLLRLVLQLRFEWFKQGVCQGQETWLKPQTTSSFSFSLISLFEQNAKDTQMTAHLNEGA